MLAAFVVRPDKPIVRVELGPTEPIEQAIQQWRATTETNRATMIPAQASATDLATARETRSARRNRFDFAQRLDGPHRLGRVARRQARNISDRRRVDRRDPDSALLPQMLADNKPAESSVATKGPAKSPSLLLVGDVDFGADPGSGDMLAVDGTAAQRRRAIQLAELARHTRRSGRHSIVIRQTIPRRIADDARPRPCDENRRHLRHGSQRIHPSFHAWFLRSSGNTLHVGFEWKCPRLTAPTGFVTSQNVSGYQPGLLSGLVLAGANRRSAIGKDDGILTALEVGEMDLHNVQLATLSACETGLGKTAGGEGLLGLQRAFQTAGAKTVVAGLWKSARQSDGTADVAVLRQSLAETNAETRSPAQIAALAVARGKEATEN